MVEPETDDKHHIRRRLPPQVGADAQSRVVAAQPVAWIVGGETMILQIEACEQFYFDIAALDPPARKKRGQQAGAANVSAPGEVAIGAFRQQHLEDETVRVQAARCPLQAAVNEPPPRQRSKPLK
jgi:hypothetical protein